MTELKPCPFCGGEAHTYKNNLWHVACERAHNGCVTMSAFITEAEAIAAWNTRQCERTNELTAERDEWKKHAMAAENVCYEAKAERDEYREKLSRALDLAHEIGRLQP